MGLPLTVNVQDFFRPKWYALLVAWESGGLKSRGSLISQFTIASDGKEYLRIGDVELAAGDAGEGFEVDSHGRAAGEDLVS